MSASKIKIRSTSGLAAVLFATFISVLIGMVALVVDLSQSYTYKSKLKSACDLASLAAVSQLANSSDIGTSKTSALNYLNDNLAATIPGFLPLNLSSTNLTIQVGTYDTSTSAFTWDEATSSPNAIKVGYIYPVMTLFADYFMISTINVDAISIAAKQPAGKALNGTSFPLAIDDSTLSEALSNGNMLTLVQTGGSRNSHFTAFDGTADENTITQEINYFESGAGTQTPLVSLNDGFTLNNAGSSITSVYSNTSEGSLEGMSFIFPIVERSGSTVTVKGFIGASIDDVNTVGETISITIMPSYIDNNFGGTTIAGSVPITDPQEKSLLANGLSLVQ
jgi:Flp pilus assembly protein TadG